MSRSLIIPRGHMRISGLVSSAEATGIKRATICEKLGVDEECLRNPSVVVAISQYLSFLKFLDPYDRNLISAAIIEESITSKHCGLLYYICMNSPSVEEYLKNLVKYQILIFGDVTTHVSFGRGGAHFTHSPTGTLDEYDRANRTATALISTVFHLRKILGPQWAPAHCTFATSRPKWSGNVAALLGVIPTFNATCSGFFVRSQDLFVPIRDADPILLEVVLQKAQSIIDGPGKESFEVLRLRELLLENLNRPDFDLAFAAREMNISEATLKRRLAEDGASFREIRNEIFYNAACGALREPGVSMTEIAHRLNYSETSAFSRAFTKVAGLTPSAFRKSIKDSL